MSIYTNLFRYRPRPLRNPMEDFLSAALADLLNRLSHQDHVAFIGDVLLQGETAERWREYIALQPVARLRWQLQRYITDRIATGFVDMVLLVNEHPAIAVENKVGAPLRAHTPLPEPAGPALEGSSSSTQLHTYGRWLLDIRQNDSWRGALVMLTHFTPPPPDFLMSLDVVYSNYGVSHRAVCRWQQVWRWARQADDDTTGSAAPAKRLTLKAELADFLEERNMGGNEFTFDDIAALGGYFGAVRRVERTLADVTDGLSQVRAKLGMGDVSRITYSPLMASVWLWSYLRQSPNQKWYFGWGIRFPEHSLRHWTEFQPPLPDVPHVFLAIGSEGKPIPWEKVPGALPAGWIPTGNSEAVTGSSLEDFPRGGEEFAEAVAEWLKREMNILYPVIDKLLQTTSSP